MIYFKTHDLFFVVVFSFPKTDKFYTKGSSGSLASRHTTHNRRMSTAFSTPYVSPQFLN